MYGITTTVSNFVTEDVDSNLIISNIYNISFNSQEYLNPLRKSESIVEPALVNEMFYQIPEILKYHEGFLKQLAVRVQDWSDNSKLGDIFVSSVSNLVCFSQLSSASTILLRSREPFDDPSIC
jgi:hypothetical protein